jgi:hypothetical protein
MHTHTHPCVCTSHGRTTLWLPCVSGTALSTTGNKHHTPCLIGVAVSLLNPNAPRLVMGSSAEENDGVRVRGEQCVYSSGAHCISIRMMRMCALVCVCARARASVCVRVREYLRCFVVYRCVAKCVRAAIGNTLVYFYFKTMFRSFFFSPRLILQKSIALMMLQLLACLLKAKTRTDGASRG